MNILHWAINEIGGHAAAATAVEEPNLGQDPGNVLFINGKNLNEKLTGVGAETNICTKWGL